MREQQRRQPSFCAACKRCRLKRLPIRVTLQVSEVRSFLFWFLNALFAAEIRSLILLPPQSNMPVLIRPMFLFVLICTIKHTLRPYRCLVPDCFFRSDFQEPSHSPEDSRLPLAKKYRHKTLKPQHVFFTIWLLYRLNKWDWNWQNPTSCFHFFWCVQS